MVSRILIPNTLKHYVTWTSFQYKPSAFIKSVISDYDDYLPKIIDKSLAAASLIESADMKDRIKMFSEYNTVGRKPVQGEVMAFTYEALEKPEVIGEQLVHQLQLIVATVELVQSFAYIWDDYMDGSTIRSGRPCWHLQFNNGLLAINDSYLLKSFINEIIIQNFKGELCYNILEIYNRVYFIGCMGQHYDTVISKSRNYDNFTIEQYNFTNKMKSSFYAIKTPLLLALALSNRLNKETYHVVDNIGTDIGTLYQIHNDLIDYLNTNGSVEGKSGTDIQEAKCSWAAVAALEECNPEQRRIFYENYGSWDPEKVGRICQLYKEVDLPKLYRQEESARYTSFLKKVSALPNNGTPSADFFNSLYSLFKNYTQDITTFMYNKH